MKFDELLGTFKNQPYFDFQSVRLLFPGNDQLARSALWRFKEAGKILELRRGIYAFAPPFSSAPIDGTLVANILYSPSYLTERWALSWYGVIPEKTIPWISVSPRVTRKFKNSWGYFHYRRLQSRLFFGWTTIKVQGFDIKIASPEKALIDLWYLESGDWSIARMDSMRFDPHPVNILRLEELAARSGQASIHLAVTAWKEYAHGIMGEEVTL